MEHGGKDSSGPDKIDCWILFPLMAIARMMPTNREPTDSLAQQLDRVFGGRGLLEGPLQISSQQQLPWFSNEPSQERLQGSDEIALLFRERLESVFVESCNRPTRRFSNSKELSDVSAILRCEQSSRVYSHRSAYCRPHFGELVIQATTTREALWMQNSKLHLTQIGTCPASLRSAPPGRRLRLPLARRLTSVWKWSRGRRCLLSRSGSGARSRCYLPR